MTDRIENSPEVVALAERLDESGVTLETVQQDFRQWCVWWSYASGHYHAVRRENFKESAASARRFAVAASTPGLLAVLLLHQTALDEAERSLGK